MNDGRFDEDGFMINPRLWDEDLAELIADHTTSNRANQCSCVFARTAAASGQSDGNPETDHKNQRTKPS